MFLLLQYFSTWFNFSFSSLMEDRLIKVIRQSFQNAKQKYNEGTEETKTVMPKILDNIKDELLFEIEVRYFHPISIISENNLFLQDMKVSLSDLSSSEWIVQELDKEEEYCDGVDDFYLWKYCLKLGPEWCAEVHIMLFLQF